MGRTIRAAIGGVLVAVGLACDAAGEGDTPADAGASPGDARDLETAGSHFSETCLFSGEPGRRMGRPTGNNAAELAGADVTVGSVPLSELRRRVPVKVMDAPPGFSVGDGFVSRSSVETDYPYLAIPIQNRDGPFACFIEARDVRWLGPGGEVIDRDDRGFIDGSVGQVPLAGFTDSCLGPGETGYLLEIGAGSFSRVASIELRIDRNFRPASPARASLVAHSHVRCEGSREIEVALESLGPEPIALRFDVVGSFVLLDEDSQPLKWGFLNARRGLGVYRPGKVMLAGAGIFFPGTSRRMHVYTRFDDASRMEARSRDSGWRELDSALAQWRRARHMRWMEARRGGWE